MSDKYLPAARRSKLLVRELAEEVLVYDEEGHRAHCLNQTAALVWRACDGRTAVGAIAEKVGAQMSAHVSEDVVWLALDQLAEFDLLTTGAARTAPASLMSRRKMLRRLGVAAAVSLPLITSVVSPTAAEAQSPCNEENCPPPMCCSGGVCLPEEQCGV
ncbi:MAG: PqqD family protein [Pyrinomonadaceae bacterium]